MAEEVIIPFKFDFAGSGLSELIKAMNDIKAAGAGAASDLAKAFGDSLDKVDKDLEETKKRLQNLSDADGLSSLSDDVERLTKEQAKNVKQSVEFVGAFKDQQEGAAAFSAEISDLNRDTKALQKQQEELSKLNQKGGDEYKKLSARIDENTSKTKALTIQKQKITSVMDREMKSALATKGSYNALAAETNVLRQRLKDMPEAFGKNEKAAAKLAAEINNNNDKLKKFDKSIGDNFRNVGNYKDGLVGVTGVTSQFGGSLGKAGGMMGSLGQGLGSLKTAFSTLKGAIAATGIGLFLLVITSVGNYLKKFDPIMDKIEQGFAAIGAVVDVVGAAFTNFFSGGGIIESFGNLGDSMRDAASAAAELKERQQDLADQEIILTNELAVLRNKEAQLLLQSKNKSLDPKQQEAFARAAIEIEEFGFKKSKENSEKKLKLAVDTATEEAKIRKQSEVKDVGMMQMLGVKARKERKELSEDEIAMLSGVQNMTREQLAETDDVKKTLQRADFERQRGELAFKLLNSGRISQTAIDGLNEAFAHEQGIEAQSIMLKEKAQNRADGAAEKGEAAAEKAAAAMDKRQKEADDNFKKSLETRLAVLDNFTKDEQNAVKKRFADGEINQETFEAENVRILTEAGKKKQIILDNYLIEAGKKEGISAEARKAIQEDLAKRINESESSVLDFQIAVNKKKVDDFKRSSDDKIKKVSEEGDRLELEIKKNLESGKITQDQADQELLKLKLSNSEKDFEIVKAAAATALADQTLNAETRLQLEKETGVKLIESEAKVIDAKIALAEKLKAAKKQEVDELISGYNKENELAFAQAETAIINSNKSEEQKKDALEALKREQIDAAIGLKDFEISEYQRIGEKTKQQEIDLEKLKQQQLLEAQKTGSAARIKEAKEFAKQVLSDALTSAKKQSEDKIKDYDSQLSQQEKNIERQQQLADEGKANTLDFERQKSAEIQQAKLFEQKRIERLQKLEAFYGLFKSFVAGGQGAAVAAGKAAAGVAIADVIAAKLAEGTDGTLGETLARKGEGGGVDGRGITYGRKHRSGGIKVEMEAGEGVLSSPEMSNMGSNNFRGLKQLLRRGRIADDIIGQSDSLRIVLPSRDPLLSKMITKLDEVKQAVRDKPTINYAFNSVGDLVTTAMKDGFKNITVEKRRRIG